MQEGRTVRVRLHRIDYPERRFFFGTLIEPGKLREELAKLSEED
jgi:hypothetical protein